MAYTGGLFREVLYRLQRGILGVKPIAHILGTEYNSSLMSNQYLEVQGVRRLSKYTYL